MFIEYFVIGITITFLVMLYFGLFRNEKEPELPVKYETYVLKCHVDVIDERIDQLQNHGFEIAGNITIKIYKGDNEEYAWVPLRRRLN